ncbi:hypothetical protein HanPSC8_Chr11g0455201 [Helianthus annuus]|nr:hypothetical protein HanPSC8_Chr11g0455201 [Helianthus annuus]
MNTKKTRWKCRKKITLLISANTLKPSSDQSTKSFRTFLWTSCSLHLFHVLIKLALYFMY